MVIIQKQKQLPQINSTNLWQKKLIYSMCTGILLFSLSACDSKKEVTETENYTMNGSTITLDENSTIKAQIKVAKVSEELSSTDLTTTGYVKAIPTNFAQIASPFAGRITKSYVRLGQYVKKGTPIFELSSSDYYSAQQEYFSAQQELKQAEINLKRQQDLLKNGVGVKRELEEAETDFQIARLALNNTAAALKIFNINPNKMRMGQSLLVTSPIEGEILTNNLILGEYLREDSEPLVTVAELSKVWVAAQVKEKDLAMITNLDHVNLKVDAYPDQHFTGKIYHINQMVDEETRSVEVLIESENQGRKLKPGMYVNVILSDVAQQLVVVPTKAVFQQNNDQYVYVQVKKDNYQRRKITTATSTENKIVVKTGLKAGETIVVDGGIYLLQAK